MALKISLDLVYLLLPFILQDSKMFPETNWETGLSAP